MSCQLTTKPSFIRSLLDVDKSIAVQRHWAGPSRGWGRRVSYSGPRDVWGPPLSLSNTKIHQNAPFWKEKIQKFLPRGARRTCFWGPRENVSLCPAVAFDGSANWVSVTVNDCWCVVATRRLSARCWFNTCSLSTWDLPGGSKKLSYTSLD